MSEENVEIVRDSLDAVNAVVRGELTGESLAKRQLLDLQFELYWHDERTFPDEPQHLRGVTEFIGWIEDLRETMDELAIDALEFIEAPGIASSHQSIKVAEAGRAASR